MTLRSTAVLHVLAASTLPLGVAVADETMRCGSWIVTSSASQDELLKKCGAPTSKDVATQDVYAPNINNKGTRKIGVTTTERWTYDRGTRAFRMIAVIVDGKLKRIERAE